MSVVLGAMIAMSPTVTLKGTLNVSMKTIILRNQMALSTFTGPGEVLLAPYMLGDIISLRLGGDQVWSVAKDAFLACTQGVERDYKAQSISKAFFSGDGLFVFKVSGTGILWITSFGAIVKKDVRWETLLTWLLGVWLMIFIVGRRREVPY
jgi:uncharacterized protein (AIM24 family)